MGELAVRKSGGTKLEPSAKVTVKKLIEAGEINSDEVVYEVTAKGPRKLSEGDLVEPGKEYGVVPMSDPGA